MNFTDTSTNTPTSWTWNFGDGYGSTSQNPTHTYTAAGTYTVSLTASNAAGSSSPVTNTVTVTSLPVAAFVMNPDNIGPVQVATNGAIYMQQIKLFDQSYRCRLDYQSVVMDLLGFRGLILAIGYSAEPGPDSTVNRVSSNVYRLVTG